MKSIILLTWILVTGSVYPLSPGIHKTSYSHMTSQQCCKAQGGTTCGTVIKDCCKQGCKIGVLNSQWCAGHSKIQPICPTCMNICEQKGGVACQVSADSGLVTCCPQAKCIKNNNGTQANGILTKVITAVVTAVLGGAAGSVLTGTHHQLADPIIQKFTGPSNYCQAGSQIDLGSCETDSFIDLVQKKALG